MNIIEGGGRHFRDLVEYLGRFSQRERRDLADCYGAEQTGASALARHWCVRSDKFAQLVDARIDSEAARLAVAALANDHGYPVETGWLGWSDRRDLVELGLLGPEGGESPRGELTWPATLAALVAPIVEIDRPSLPLLMGSLDRSTLSDRADELGLSGLGSRGELYLRCADFLTRPGAVEGLLDRLPARDYLGPAVMVVELGGQCFWREVFGEGPAESADDETVVPLVGDERRSQEREMADALVGLSILYPFEPAGADYRMVAVPEELQAAVWRVGRTWLRDWLRDTHRRGEEAAVSGTPVASDDVRAVGKWLACETLGGGVRFESETPTRATVDALAERADISRESIRQTLVLLTELSVLTRTQEGGAEIGPEAGACLDGPVASLVGEGLYEWTAGFAGRRADQRAPHALGLDAAWRERAVEMLRARRGAVPHWMRSGGVPPEETGCGWLREFDDHPPKMLSSEVDLVTGVVWRAKVTWIDLIDQFRSGRAYPIDRVAELLQLSTAHALFTEIGDLLEPPPSGYYLPVQRPSVLGDPTRLAGFVGWTRHIVERLMGPLGVAELVDDGERVVFETSLLGVETPPGWPRDDRRQLLQTIVGEGEVGVASPRSSGELRVLDGPATGRRDASALDEPLEELVGAVRRRGVRRFEGGRLLLGQEGDGG